MAKWNKLIITEAGYQLSAQTLAEKKIQYTHAQTTDKDMSAMTADQLKAITKLDSVMQDLPVGTISVQDDHTVNVPVKVVNKDLTTDYLLYGLALFAKPADGDEILYGILTASKPDLIPGQTGATVTGTSFKLKVHVGDAQNVNIIISPDGSVSNDELDGILKNYILVTDLDARFKNYYTKQEVDNEIKNVTPKLPDNLVTLSDDNVSVKATTKDGEQTGVFVTQETLDKLAKDTEVVHRNPDTGKATDRVDFAQSNLTIDGNPAPVIVLVADKEAAIAGGKQHPTYAYVWGKDLS
ncbi:hypothetical protein [Secundilactobacillus kimchicus]|uniref:Uncharacterized protein n=1 Tax=Secundilactobacillus kimchicus JCM 15530 TaxID=1302272 RepID=A0A0R1HP27_9LACO|nr:hypothetical protein [Secundilactobacillus kimchicus]KRK48200.1 hypothetical protein FC96_GL001939 [Secundilactobacillus kimchicus JCM 15530]